MFNNGLSLADIAAATGNGKTTTNGFGDGNGWWVLIILFALFGGWGNGAWGNGNNGYSAAATQADIQRGFDTQAVTSKLNGLENGLCDGFYAMNTGMLNGFNTLQNAVTQGNFTLQQAVNADTVTNMQNANALASQIQNNGCENRQAIAQVRYDMATDTCSITNAVNTQAQAIMNNCNANYKALHDEIVANRMADKDETIAQLRSTVQAMNLAASQQAQNNYIVNSLRPPVNPAYIVQNPYASTGNLPCQMMGVTT
jgi:hypothetical protein